MNPDNIFSVKGQGIRDRAKELTAKTTRFIYQR